MVCCCVTGVATILIMHRYLDALHWTVDGNFQLNQRKKPMDPNDFMLTEGVGYFAHAREYSEFVRSLLKAPKDVEVSQVSSVVMLPSLIISQKSTCN